MVTSIVISLLENMPVVYMIIKFDIIDKTQIFFGNFPLKFSVNIYKGAFIANSFYFLTLHTNYQLVFT